MPAQRMSLLLITAACSAWCRCALAVDDVTAIAPGLTQRNGIDAETGIAYSRIMLQGSLVRPGSPANAAPLPFQSTPPMLIAQCTRQQNGNLAFELLADYGGIQDTSFHAPWHSTGGTDIFPPTTQKVMITFEFFGYTRVKPISRQWESIAAVPGQWRYNNPSHRSHNLEESAFYLQYLRALPTLRLTQDGKAAQFNVGPWMEAVRKEPLCKASGL